MYPIQKVRDDHFLGLPIYSEHVLIPKFMPEYDNIPEEFKDESNPWVKIQRKRLLHGIPHDIQFIPKEGVDCEAALKHCHRVQNSCAVPCKHRDAGVAFLLHEWFSDILNKNGKSLIQ